MSWAAAKSIVFSFAFWAVVFLVIIAGNVVNVLIGTSRIDFLQDRLLQLGLSMRGAPGASAQSGSDRGTYSSISSKQLMGTHTSEIPTDEQRPISPRSIRLPLTTTVEMLIAEQWSAPRSSQLPLTTTVEMLSANREMIISKQWTEAQTVTSAPPSRWINTTTNRHTQLHINGTITCLEPLYSGMHPDGRYVPGSRRHHREEVVAVIKLLSSPGCAFGKYRTRIGVEGSRGEKGRHTVQDSYVRALAESKIVVTHEPYAYEGDSRTPEALASGALVLVNRLIDQPPWLIDGKNVVLYDSLEDMIGKVLYYLEHVDEADSIARNGPDAALLPSQMVDTILDAVVGKNRSARVYLQWPIKQYWNQGEFLLTLTGLRANKRVTLLNPDPVVCRNIGSKFEKVCPPTCRIDADLVLIEQFKLWQSGANQSDFYGYYKNCGVPIVALDWNDNMRPVWWDSRIDFFFKRSRANPKNHSLHYDERYPFPVGRPLHYPIKYDFAEAMQKHLGEQQAALRSKRIIDVACFFPCEPAFGCP